MQTLYVLRHGIALPHGTPGMLDDDRPLTDKGRRRMKQIADGLRRLKVAPDRIVTSPLPRALETAEIVAEGLGLPDRLERDGILKAGRDAGAIREWLSTRAEESLMIVGHNPAFSDLVNLLTVGQGPPLCELAKGGVAAFVEEQQGEAGFRLDWLATPRLLRKLAR